MSEKTVLDLIENAIDKKPAGFREVFEELMVDVIQQKVEEHSQTVAENMFVEVDNDESRFPDPDSVHKAVKDGTLDADEAHYHLRQFDHPGNKKPSGHAAKTKADKQHHLKGTAQGAIPDTSGQ